MKKIDIVIISPGLLETGTDRGGGCEVTDYNIALQLSKEFKVAIVSPYYKKFMKTLQVNKCFSILQIPFPAMKTYPPKTKIQVGINFMLIWIYSILVTLKILSMIIVNKIKIIVVHNCQTSLFSTLVAKFFGVKIIYAEGNISPWTELYVYPHKSNSASKMWFVFNLYLLTLMCKWATCIRTQSESIKKGMLRRGINAIKINVIPAGINPDEFPPIKTIASDNFFRVGFIGRLMDEKGIPLLLEIIKEAEITVPNVRFLIFGDGPYKNDFSNLSNIEHVGKVPRNELGTWLSKIQSVLFFQRELGRAELEAMSAGKGIIACNIGETPNFIIHGENGLLCPPNKKDYIEAIRILSNDHVLLHKLSENARKSVVDAYCWETVGLQWILMCHTALDNPNNRSTI